MKKAIMIFSILIMASLILACSPSTGSSDTSLPQVNVDDYATTTTISDLLVLDGIYECSWDFAGLDSSGVYPTTGSFMMNDGSYYLENTIESDLTGTVERYALYDANTEMFYSWNNQASAPIGTTMNAEMYAGAIVDNTIGYRAYFDLLENVDYGIVCEQVASVTLPSLPDLTWI